LERGLPVDFAETSEQAMLRASVRKIGASFGHAYYAECARAGRKTDALWAALGREGFLAVNLPEAHGGAGLGVLELAIVCEELAAQGCPAVMLVVSPGICGSILSRCGTEEQKQQYLPRMAEGAYKMAFAITEPDAGSNSHKLSTVATRDGDHWRLRGQKYYISGVDEADSILVVTRTGTDAKGRGRLSLFVVDTDAPGLQKTLIPVEMVTPEKQYTLFFDDVRVHESRLLGAEGEGLKQVFFGLNPERITGAALGNGIGLYALQKAAAYANERKVWGVPIGAHQGLSHPLAKARIEVELARLMTTKAGWLYDNGQDAGEAANMAKYAAAEAALFALDQAIQTHGGNGLSTEFGLADMWGVTRLLRTAPVSREMILNFVAEHTLRLPRSY
jgi:alkylation response protein AidB-like acyl-CoA dehydrogenase